MFIKLTVEGGSCLACRVSDIEHVRKDYDEIVVIHFERGGYVHVRESFSEVMEKIEDAEKKRTKGMQFGM